MSNTTTTTERQPAMIVPPLLLSGCSTILANDVLRMWNVTHPEGGERWSRVDVLVQRWPNDQAHIYVETETEPVILKLTPAEACTLSAGLIQGAVEAAQMNRLRLPDDDPHGTPSSPVRGDSRVVGERPADWHPSWCDPARCRPGRHFSGVDDRGSDVDDVRVDYGISQLHDTDSSVHLPDVSVTIENTAFVDMAVTAQFTPANARELAVQLLRYAAAAEEHANDDA